jgi:spore photoproduct lyase
LFLGKKKGTLVKEAPDAYGLGDAKHYYYIHAYNCIYECQYCYLQGYFNTPDIVLFLNHHEIVAEMKKIMATEPDCWFHAGEFSDSLALSHITDEFSYYYNFFKDHPSCKLELRTKSSNIKSLLAYPPLKNIFVSYTLSSKENSKIFDMKCPSLIGRIRSIEKLVHHGYQIGIHLDPMIYTENFEQEYTELSQIISRTIPKEQLGYISIGVVRFTKDVYREVEANYPDSQISRQDYVKSFDGKIRYNKPMRRWMMNFVKDKLLKYYPEEKIYFCMEE